MVTVYDVAPSRLVAKVAEKLASMGISAPAWVGKVKSGAHRQRLPQQKNFWYLRLASLLRNAYIRGSVGVRSLRTHYGGRKVRGVKPEEKRKAGGSIIRKGLQALEAAGLMEKKKKGRQITPAGRKLLDAVARELSAQG
ncbi:MAG: 30S ribosomal protein S19e [Candidatus Micrarchaeota archaeon]|nr:30S ribosomal protein S19e [Candidatus Micrarchaeota archaeon]